ncbi:hypothetical protein EMCRGX_G013370 [Ephydatia muelleri]
MDKKRLMVISTVILFARSVLLVKGLNCQTAKSCSECVQRGVDCIWCTLPNVTYHCVQRNTAEAHSCGMYVEDKVSNFRSKEKNDLLNKTLISPQSAYIQVRVGDSVAFNVSVMTSRTYPVDFYILMDLSSSLRDDVETLKNTTHKIVATLLNISSNYAVGFGSFVDKPVPPFVPNIPYSTPTPKGPVCFNHQAQCAEPYSYRHILTLTNDSQKLQYIVNTQLNISHSSDNPESALDGAGQVLACKKLIGWRNEAFHMMMIITDANYHRAGDGKLGGVIVPFDGRCHMDRIAAELYQYNQSTFYDYPSIPQLKNLFTDVGVTPIFAVTKTAQNYYKDLVKQLGTGVVGELANDSSNLAQIIAEKYLKAIGHIQFSVPEIDGLTVTVQAVSGCETKLPSGCADVKLEQQVTFRVTVALDKCTVNIMRQLQSQQSFDLILKIPVLAQEFIIHLTPICKCSCEMENEMNSATCHAGGSLACGLCSCNMEQKRFGTFCECQGNQACPIGLANLNCSGADHGTCLGNCFECQCKEKYFGPACQCNAEYCPAVKGQVCSNHGTCQCPHTVCECNTAPLSQLKYSGTACSCDPDFCVNPKTNAVCSRSNITEGKTLCHCSENKAQCKCGCTCPAGTALPFCQDETEVSDVCMKQEKCALCVLRMGGGSKCDGCKAEILSDIATVQLQKSRCPPLLFDGCYYDYFVDPFGTISVSMVPDSCPPASVNPWYIAIGVLGGVIITGIISLVLIKLILMIMDRVEYKKFAKHLAEANWAQNDNPLYVSPTRHYDNVAYERNRSRPGN